MQRVFVCRTLVVALGALVTLAGSVWAQQPQSKAREFMKDVIGFSPKDLASLDGGLRRNPWPVPMPVRLDIRRRPDCLRVCLFDAQSCLVDDRTQQTAAAVQATILPGGWLRYWCV